MCQTEAACVGSIAQLGEHLPYKQEVIGSSPIVPTNLIHEGVAQLVEHVIFNHGVKGSNPFTLTIYAVLVQW